MSDILTRIEAYKREEIAAARRVRPLAEVEAQARAASPPRGTAKDGAGQTAGSNPTEWIVYRVTDITVPPVDLNSDDMKKLKDQLVRGISDEQIALYVARLEKDIGTTINEEGFAQVTGAANN